MVLNGGGFDHLCSWIVFLGLSLNFSICQESLWKGPETEHFWPSQVWDLDWSALGGSPVVQKSESEVASAKQ